MPPDPSIIMVPMHWFIPSYAPVYDTRITSEQSYVCFTFVFFPFTLASVYRTSACSDDLD